MSFVNLTICGVDISVAADLFHEQQRLRRRISKLNGTERLSNSQRGQTEIVLAILERVALHFVIESRSDRATLLVVIIEELQLWKDEGQHAFVAASWYKLTA